MPVIGGTKQHAAEHAQDRKSTRLNSSHVSESRMPSSPFNKVVNPLGNPPTASYAPAEPETEIGRTHSSSDLAVVKPLGTRCAVVSNAASHVFLSINPLGTRPPPSPHAAGLQT